MRALKTFEEYCREGIMLKGKADIERAKSLIDESDRKMRSLHTNLEKVGITEDNTNDYIEQCYDAILMNVRAILYSKGYSSSGQGAHEAEVAYLRVLKLSDKEVVFMNELRYLRNGVIYYGKLTDKEYAAKVIEFTKKIHPKLRKLFESIL